MERTRWIIAIGATLVVVGVLLFLASPTVTNLIFGR